MATLTASATGEEPRLNQVGMMARSPEGHAARGMAIKGHEDLWVEIQANTFRNWVNEHLRNAPPGDLAGRPEVRDLSADLCDGTRLVALVESLQKRRLKTPAVHRRPTNRHHCLENVTAALDAIAADGVKLVNIGNVDIVNGNLKLILGLIWSLIVRYQIGRSKFPPKKLMLAWLQAVIPERRVSNFTTDWNSGVLLSALLDYCRPGLFPHWREIDSRDSVGNCRRAMELARREFGIPMVLEPEYLASPFLDELSGMTYLSYFMKEDSPGFHATLRWVNSQLPSNVGGVKNFTREWNDGKVLCSLVRSLGGPIPGYDKLSSDPSQWESNLNLGIRGGERLGVEPILRAKDMSDRNVEHLGIMAYAAHFQWIKPRPRPSDRISVSIDSNTGRVNEPMPFRVNFLVDDVNLKEVTAEVESPSGIRQEIRLSSSPGGARGSFTPTEVGMHRLVIRNEGEVASGCPIDIRVLPELSTVQSRGMDPCAVGSIVEVLVNSNGGTAAGEVDVTAHSPSGRALGCPVAERGSGVHTATFQPDEAGEWTIAVTHGGRHIQGGPFTCFVFDPNGIELRGLDTPGNPGQPLSFTVDSSGTGGLGEVCLDVVHAGRSIPLRTERLGDSLARVTFIPPEAGKYRIYVYFNGSDIKGSPFSVRVGSHRSRRSKKDGKEKRSTESSYLSEKKSSDNLFSSDKRASDSYLNEKRVTDTFSSEKRHTDTSYLTANGGSGPNSPRNLDVSGGSLERSNSPYNITARASSPMATKVSLSSPLGNRVSTDSYYNEETSKLTTSTSSVTTKTMEQRLARTHIIDGGRASPSSPMLNGGSPPGSQRVFSAHVSQQHSSSIGQHHSPDPARIRSSVWSGRRGSVDNIDEPAVDTSSNVRVSSILSSSNARRDSWDAIAKTKSILSYGSLESLANIAVEKRDVGGGDEVDASHQRIYRASSPTVGLNISSKIHDTVVTGDGMRLAPLHRNSSLTITLPSGVDSSQVSVTVTGPSRRTVPVRIIHSSISNREITAQYTATEIGEHLVDVRIGDTKVPGSPFRSYAYNSSAIQVGRIPNGIVGQPVEFEIDGSNAGSGNLEILVNGGHVTSSVRNLGVQRFLASFVPHEAVLHVIEMKFNGETVPGSPWKVGVMSSTMAASPVAQIPAPPPAPPVVGGGPIVKMAVVGEAVRLVPAGATAAFQLSALGFHREDVRATITSPSKRTVPSRLVEDGGPGSFRVEFTPTEVGAHTVDVAIAGSSLPGGPLLAKVYDAGRIRVTDVGPAIAGRPCQFRVDASQAGEGQLEISINDGEVPNHVQVVGGGRCLVTFTPEYSRPHLIDIKFNGETVPGCPYVCSVADTQRVSVALSELELIPVGERARFSIAVGGVGGASLAVSVRGPTGEVPVKVSGSVHDPVPSRFSAEFTPREVGAHTITVECNGSPVAGTPFVAKAYDAKRVVVGPLPPRASVGKSLQFTVDASQAGEGNLEITISARGHNIPTQVHPQGNARFAVSFVPLIANDHVISINFNKEPVPGSPFVARVPADPHHMVVSGQSLSTAAVGKPSHFNLSNVPGSVEDVEVRIEGPNGQSVPAQVKDSGGQTFRVEFCPRIAGEHRIHVASITRGGEDGASTSSGNTPVPVPGSPFSCKVYDVKAIKVKEVGRGMVNRPVTFVVETSQAGPGNLEVTVNGGRVATSAQARGPHTYAISFTPREATPHAVQLRFNGEDVPGSPFTCEVLEAARVTWSGGSPLEKVPVGRVASFFVEAPMSGVPGEGLPVVRVMGPSRRTVNANIIENEVTPGEGSPQRGKHTVEFTPTEVGDHSVEVRIDGDHIEGSPFLVKAYDSSKVKVTDINSGVVGKPVFFSINASQAGAGNLEIIVSVGGRNVPNYVQSEGNAKFRVNFKPQEVAIHNLSVRFNGEPVPGSPFTCKISEAVGGLMSSPMVGGAQSAVVSGSALRSAALGRPAIITVDPRGADVNRCSAACLSPSGRDIPTRVSGSPSSKFKVELTPFEVGRHTLSVMVDGEHVKGSPFTCNVYDVGKVKVTGLVPSKVGKPVTFTVDASEAGEGTLELVVSEGEPGGGEGEGKGGATVKAEVVACSSRGLYDVTFVPHHPLPHFVAVSFNEEDVPGSPFKCEVQDLGPKELRQQQQRRGANVTGASGQATMVQGEGPRTVCVGTPAFFDLRTPAGLQSNVDVEVLGPDGSRVPCLTSRREDAGGGGEVVLRTEYTPSHVGPHYISVHGGREGNDTRPFMVESFDPSKAKVTQMGEAVIGKPCSLTVDARSAGQGSLSVSVRTAGQDVKHAVREVEAISAGREDGLGKCYEVTYHPSIALPHRIEIKLNGVHIKGSPLEVAVGRDPATTGKEVSATGLGLYQGRSGQPASFTIETLGRPAEEFDVVVGGPAGAAVPVRCYQQKAGGLLAEFTPTLAGTYKVDILHGSNPVRGSPFFCQVFDASKVIIEGDASTRAVAVNEKIAFKLNRKEAGYAELDVTVTSPLGRNLPIEVKGERRLQEERGLENGGDASRGVDVIEFFPTVAGLYRFQVTYGGEEVPGSPVTFVVVEGNGVVARAIGEGLQSAQVGVAASFRIEGTKAASSDMPTTLGEPIVRVDGPESEVLCRLERDDGGGRNGLTGTSATFVATYIPTEVGTFDVRITWDGREIPGSPFHPRVTDPRKVRVIGGWESFVDEESGRLPLAVHHSKRVTFDTSEAGPGQLTAEFKGPSGTSVPVALEAVGGGTLGAARGRVRLLLTPREPGDHTLSLSFAGKPLPRSPMQCVAAEVGTTPAASDGTPVRVVLTGRGLAGARCGEEAEFVIDGSRAGPGRPEVSLTGMKSDVPVRLTSLGNGVHKATYTASVPGPHLLNVMWSDRQVRGCPLKVVVSPALSAVGDSSAGATEAAQVVCSGEGLKAGVLGQEIRSFIDTRRAGPGELTAQCVGPSKVAYCELYDHGDGTFTLNVKPQEPGRHTLAIKYGGEHVNGSPFPLRVSGGPDASRVRVHGPGVDHGVLATFESRFVCDTRGAGAGQLTVRVRGPKGAFRVEMQRESHRDRTILCKFDPTEPGDYRIEVKWAGEHVPGSPFHVWIFDTQEELSRFLQGSPMPSSGIGMGTLDPYGSIGYSTGYAHMNFGHTSSWRGSSQALL
ncbi:filamin-A isoform X2 [Ischnura elegans]|uniref:filamin-A isoform X2 n=1 Tax=Ischnura elegans TaxID=197161 RepID=UPI001ED88F2A|nr:filamin-A isoform X2 [Ischnura elegans]